MKKHISVLTLICILPLSRAVDYSQIEVINLGNPPGVGGDTWYRGGQKINDDFILLAGWIADLSTNPPGSILFTNTLTGAPGSSAAVTNLGGGVFQLTIPQGSPGTNGATGAAGPAGTNGVSASIAVGTVTTGSAGSPVIVTNVGSTTAAVLNFTIPQGAVGPAGPAGTNTVTNTLTAIDFTNTVLSSIEYTAYQTNYAFWDRVAHGSNYLGRFTNGVSRWVLIGGDNGQNPPFGFDMTLLGSYSGTNSWFALTNGFYTTNAISLVAQTNGPPVTGGSIVNPGICTIFNVDHWELYRRTNYFDYQYLKRKTPVVQNDDVATKIYVDQQVAGVIDGHFYDLTDTNGFYHLLYTRFNVNILDIKTAVSYIPIKAFALDGAGTHGLLDIYQTNLIPNWFVESATNLISSPGVIQWGVFTNYSASTNSGVVTLSIPLDITEEMRFFRARGATTNSVTWNAPIAFNMGTIYPSNTWNWSSITSQIPDRAIWTGNSNGWDTTTLWRSNSQVYYLVQSNSVKLRILGP